MQTFLPYGEDFARTASVLDRQRLGKQRVEALQILNTLTGRSTGWATHPAVKMWRGHEEVLAHYALDICYEWSVVRGYKDTCADKIREMFPVLTPAYMTLPPVWLEDVALSHQSNLIRKLPEHYGPLWPDVDPNIPYYWPV